MSDPARAAVDERRPRGWRSFAFDVALALLATGFELASVVDAPGPASVPAIVLAAVAGGALVLRRSAPLAVLATTLAAGVAVVALDEEPAGVAGLIALYTTAAMCERRVSLAALVPTAAIAAGGSAATADAEGRTASASFGATVAVLLVTGVWALGAYVQTRQRYARALQERAADAEREREQLARIAVHEQRASIARELHDIVAHSVSVMLVGVRGARDVLRTAPDVADDTLARVEASGEQSLAELRRILALLRGPEHGAESRPQPSLAELDELVARYRDAGLPVRLEVIGEPRPLPGGVELSVYRIVQEALTNVLKHTHPTRVTVTLAFRGSRLEIEVVDDGTTGHSAAAERSGDQRAAPDGGHGLVGMRERVAVLGGELETGLRAGGGFRVAARLPVGGDA
jgi:signal transduction histidine kinase